MHEHNSWYTTGELTGVKNLAKSLSLSWIDFDDTKGLYYWISIAIKMQ